MAVLLETSVGDIVVDLYVEERPKCSVNFLKLCKIKFYNYSLFFSVQRNFIAQTGDPLGSGEGGQSIWGVLQGEDYKFFEAETNPRLKHLKTGTLSMVNNGSGCHASQFFLTLSENLDNLDGNHTVFGEVAEGFDELMKISEAYCDKDGRPFQDIRIYHTVVLEDPFDDPEGLVAPDRSPSPPMVITDSNRIGAEEEIDDYKGLTEDQIKELISKREAKANAQILEMVGDIPDADAKPPENVLFVCKLNPVTTDEDLEIIFSRFGAIASCEVIRDQKSGDSLQYAFIEFENEEDCTKAYFKMDNVLIDDRRIHVDFSQSLAKVKGISRRKYSEEDPEGEGKKGKKEDGLVAKKKTQDDRYEMVFGDVEGGVEEGKGKEDGGKIRERKGDKGRGVEERRDRGHGNEGRREKGHDREERSGGRGNEGRREKGRSGEDKERNGKERREKEKRTHGSRERHRHSRSRSRSRDRHSHHKHHGRHRRDHGSRSRDRHHRRH